MLCVPPPFAPLTGPEVVTTRLVLIVVVAAVGPHCAVGVQRALLMQSATS